MLPKFRLLFQPNVSHEDIIQSMLPTTIVDLQSMNIKQTYLYHEYIVLRKESLAIEIEKLSKKRKDNLWDDLFRPVKVAAPCIEKILLDVFRLPTYLREACILALKERCLIPKIYHSRCTYWLEKQYC